MEHEAESAPTGIAADAAQPAVASSTIAGPVSGDAVDDAANGRVHVGVSHEIPTRTYLNSMVTPVLLEGMRLVAKERPADPLAYLGHFFLRESVRAKSQPESSHEMEP